MIPSPNGSVSCVIPWLPLSPTRSHGRRRFCICQRQSRFHLWFARAWCWPSILCWLLIAIGVIVSQLKTENADGVDIHDSGIDGNVEIEMAMGPVEVRDMKRAGNRPQGTAPAFGTSRNCTTPHARLAHAPAYTFYRAPRQSSAHILLPAVPHIARKPAHQHLTQAHSIPKRLKADGDGG